MAKLPARIRVAVVWIDWYPYHAARFRGLMQNDLLHGQVAGVELVAGVGVHAGLKFREPLPADLPVETLLPASSWRDANKFTLAYKLWRALSRMQPQVVLVPGYYTLPGLAAALWARAHGAVSVLMTESTAHDHARNPVKEWLKSAGMNLLFDWAIAGGHAHIQYLNELGFHPGRIVGQYDVVDNAFFRDGVAALRTSAGEEAPREDFLYVGRLAPEKNVATLLRSWIDYRRQGGTWSLTLVGDGPETPALRELAASSGLAAHVTFAGLRNSTQLLPFYARAGCFVLPSTREPWGLVVNEAMAAGLPVLVSRNCGCAFDLVQPGVNGNTFDPEDTAELTSALITLAGLPLARREQMGAESLRQIAAYSPEGFGASVAKICRRASSSNSAPSVSTKPALGRGSQ